jgi:hypothetical protein
MLTGKGLWAFWFLEKYMRNILYIFIAGLLTSSSMLVKFYDSKPVLPSDKEIKMFGTKIIKLANTTHNEMDDHAIDMQRKEIKNHILTFLND